MSVVAHVVNDDDYCNDLNGARLQWWIEKGNEKFLSGDIELPSVPYYGTYRSPLSIDIPQDLASGDYVLKGEIWMNGRKISHNESEIFIAGQDWNNKDAIGKTIYVYDSSAGEQTRSRLQKLGYMVKPIRTVNGFTSQFHFSFGKGFLGQ